ncbi:MAG: hypothetical protein ABSB75_02240 [Candidatus Limnocylindrales bacterium]
MRRGGCVILQISELLHGEAFPDLSLAALGAWVRLRAASELTGEPIGKREVDRLGISAEVLAELVGTKIVVADSDHYQAIGMPEPERNPSDDPEKTRERQEAHRLGISVKELRARKSNPPLEPLPSDQVRSGQVRSHESRRDDVTNGVTDEDHDAAYLRAHGLCLRCRQPGDENNPIDHAGRHRFPDCRTLHTIEATA